MAKELKCPRCKSKDIANYYDNTGFKCLDCDYQWKDESRRNANRMDDQVSITLNFTDVEKQFKSSFTEVQKVIHQIAKDKGWWDDRTELFKTDNEIVIAAVLALIHSEISEALESVRHGFPQSDQMKGYDNFEIELADVIIRVMDLAEWMNIDLGSALVAKVKFNSNREHKHGGKRL